MTCAQRFETVDRVAACSVAVTIGDGIAGVQSDNVLGYNYKEDNAVSPNFIKQQYNERKGAKRSDENGTDAQRELTRAD